MRRFESLRAPAVVGIALSLLAITGCMRPGAEAPAERVIVEAPSPGLAASLQAEPRGDTVFLTLRVTNPTDTAVSLTFPTGQSFDFVAEVGGSELWRWSEDQMFTQAIRHERIDAGETEVFEGQWVPAEPVQGEVRIRGFLLASEHRLEQQTRVQLP